MAYATNADILRRLGPTLYVQLTDDVESGTADEDKVTEARVAAESEIDSYLARHYAVPVDVAAHPEVAGLLRSLTVDLAEVRLRLRKPPMHADLVRRRADAIAWLERVAAGTVRLPSVAELPANEAAGIRGAVTGSQRTIERREMEDL
jgi:phage gp36-like protein